MDHKAIVETVFKAVIAALPGELGALLGQELTCSEITCQITSDDNLYSAGARPKSTLAHLKVSGENEGEAFLILPIKTSVIFGGTLIMLPQDQIEENAKKEVLDGEVADAYGEVANILAGVLTQVFLDKYPKNMRFVRTDVETLGNVNTDGAAKKPFAAGNYFHLSTELAMGGQNLGKLEIATPAILLGLESETAAPSEASATAAEPTLQEAEPPAAATEPEPQPAEQTPDEQAPEPAPTIKADPPAPQAEVVEAPEKPAQSTKAPFADSKKIADVVLKATIEQVTEEVGALLGQTLGYSDLKLEMVTKADFFDSHCTDKSILSHMTVSGGRNGNIYLVTRLKDATLMGGTLIMLPDDEIAAQMSAGNFEGEVADAYGEVANIISGGLTQTFLDRYPQQLRFVKTTEETIVPTKITAADETPFPDGLYYLASCAISLQDKPLDRLKLLFPAEILGLENYGAELSVEQPPAVEQTAETPKTTTTAATGQAPSTPSAARPAPAPPADAQPIILIIADAQEDAESIKRNLVSDSYEMKVIGYKDDIREVFSSNPVIGVFLLMSEVGEKGFSVAIKLQSCGYALPPVIAGGPEWTRTSVLKAVKYGARDILVTPASDDEIREKAHQHMMASA